MTRKQDTMTNNDVSVLVSSKGNASNQEKGRKA
jgi:hypothetical protein